MKVNGANLLAFFNELQLEDDGNSWKVKELFFLLLVLWLALMFPSAIPPESTSQREYFLVKVYVQHALVASFDKELNIEISTIFPSWN